MKEQVLKELPPKRRQILRLILKRSDIDLAIDACKVVNSDASANNDTEDGPLHIAADAPDGNFDIFCISFPFGSTFRVKLSCSLKTAFSCPL